MPEPSKFSSAASSGCGRDGVPGSAIPKQAKHRVTADGLRRIGGGKTIQRRTCRPRTAPIASRLSACFVLDDGGCVREAGVFRLLRCLSAFSYWAPRQALRRRRRPLRRRCPASCHHTKSPDSSARPDLIHWRRLCVKARLTYCAPPISAASSCVSWSMPGAAPSAPSTGSFRAPRLTVPPA